MFEDFENRSGFWKDLGSNFTINYSGDAPSFLTSGEMWSAMDGSETQTLAAWENGWVLTNNPDGTMTATPKYTSGLISKTLVRVPVGPPSPMSAPTGGVGGVQVAFTADDEDTMVSVKIDTTQPNKSPDFVVSHSLPGFNNTEFTSYGTDWEQYKTMPYVENNKDTHCFTVVESNDAAVPVGTEYGNCPDENPAESGLPNNLLLYGGIAAVAVVVLLI
tara:strand:- start:672 stop:1325 length:654 start_codon:yes stop_codon:yes gene_type:complete